MEPITVQRTVPTTPEKAWDFFTQPHFITQWNFASPDWCCPSATNTLEVGGTFSYRMEAKDGSMGFDFEGVFDVLEPGRELRYRLPDGRKVQVQFESISGGTRIIETFDPENQNSLELQRNGWQAILDNFAALVQRNSKN